MTSSLIEALAKDLPVSEKVKLCLSLLQDTEYLVVTKKQLHIKQHEQTAVEILMEKKQHEDQIKSYAAIHPYGEKSASYQEKYAEVVKGFSTEHVAAKSFKELMKQDFCPHDCGHLHELECTEDCVKVVNGYAPSEPVLHTGSSLDDDCVIEAAQYDKQ